VYTRAHFQSTCIRCACDCGCVFTSLIISVCVIPDESPELYIRYLTDRTHTYTHALEISWQKEAFGRGLVCFKPHLESVVFVNEKCEEGI